MGANVSQEVDAAIEDMFSVVNNTTATCVQRGTQSQSLTISCPACPGGTNVTVEDITFNESAVYNTSCSEAVMNNTNINQDISMQISQVAMAIAQQFQLSVANVNEITKLLTQISDMVSNDTVLTCVQQVAQNQGLEIFCPSSPGADGVCNITVKGITFDERFTPINDCILQTSNSTGLVQQITDIVQQTGTAKVESIFGPLIAIIIVIIVIIGAVLFGGTKALGDWRLWVVIIVLILIYLALAFWRHWFPFEHKSS